MKHELLVPVGNYASLVSAINNGADAVYLGGKRFGARAFANNFTDEELEKAIKLSHLYGVKVYITVNTLIYENEIKEALEYIQKIHEYGVDAVIMQDVGLIDLVHQMLPNLEIHASTQMHNHSSGSLKILKDLGIKRVVFAREMPFDYLNDIKTDLEKEVFIHGSLCISYSGQCLFSSRILNRSGNRGECAGMCRLPYKLMEDDKYIKTSGDYLLSPKDLCSINDFEKLMKSNIKSFKIEGRMKSPEYVGVVTRIYKTLMNQYENGEPLNVKESDIELLKSIFNREYTKGYLFNDYDIMNFAAPNHLGITIGHVIDVTPKKIKIRLNKDLHQFEGIRFKESNKGLVVNYLYDEKDNLINCGKKDSVVYLDNFINLNSKDELLLTTPIYKESENITKKIKISMYCKAKLHEPINIVVNDGDNEVFVVKEIVDTSINSPVTKERIEEVLRKTGDTPFEVDNLKIDCDNNIFIPIGKLNSYRREILDELKTLRENKKVDVVVSKYKEPNINTNVTKNINVLCRTKKQIEACEEMGIKNIIVDNPDLMSNDYIFKIPRDKMNHDYSYSKLLLTDYASLEKYPNNIGDYHLNVTNHYTYNYLSKYLSSVMLSTELTNSQMKDILDNFGSPVNIEVLLYGREELMIMKYCPLKKVVNKDLICRVCKNDHQYFFEDRNNSKYPIITNKLTHGSRILYHTPINKLNQIKEYLDMGITNFRVELYDEDYAETKQILSGVNLL